MYVCIYVCRHAVVFLPGIFFNTADFPLLPSNFPHALRLSCTFPIHSNLWGQKTAINKTMGHFPHALRLSCTFPIRSNLWGQKTAINRTMGHWQ